MKNYIILTLILLSIMSCTQKGIKYPQTRKCDTVDKYFGNKVADPYRWLENDTSTETAQWVAAENEVTFGYLNQIPFRAKIKNRLTSLWNYEKYTTPFFEAGYYYFYKNDGLQNQYVLYRMQHLDDAPQLVLDPNKLSDDGTVSLQETRFSKDGKYLLYSISRSGSDWQEIFVRELASGKDLGDHIQWCKFTNIAYHDEGFYYSGYTEPKKGEELSSVNLNHKVFYHKIGTSQKEDLLVYENPKYPQRSFSVSITDDEKYLVMYEYETTHGNALYYKEVGNSKSKFTQLAEGFQYDFGFVDNIGDKFLIHTNYLEPHYKLIQIDLKKPKRDFWKEIIPATNDVLTNCTIGNKKIVATYLTDAHNKVDIFELNGTRLHSLDLPGIGSVSVNADRNDSIAFYSFISFTVPTFIYKYDFATNKSEEFFRPKINFEVSNYQTKQIFYTSKDGTKIPMFIVSKKDVKLDGNNPTLLYGYGGFNISLTPTFSVSRLVFLENGGIYCMANLRGGGEYGEEWHKAGTILKKQNVFDDFISAAEYLIKQKYTSPQKLAIQGGSNGGLLIGAVINQRPELFRAALPAVGVMDMLRYHKFTIGWSWRDDYGTSDDKTQFKNLIKFSPLHNISDTKEYPSVLVTTADHDDRVVPAHSFKYIATLQEKYKGKNPVLIRIDTKAGHGGGKPTTKIIEESSDLWSFTFFNLGMDVK